MSDYNTQYLDIGYARARAGVASLPELNVQLLEKVMSHIDNHPDEHNQTSWASRNALGCGTAYCFAGWAAIMTTPDGTVPVFEYGESTANRLKYTDQLGLVKHVDIYTRAVEQLGVTGEEAEMLFYWHNTRNDLRAMVAELVAAETARLGAVWQTKDSAC